MSARVDIVLHLEVADQEPGEPQTVASLEEWLMPAVRATLHRVMGYPGDSAVTWAGDPRNHNYEVLLPDCEHRHLSGAIDEDATERCPDCTLLIWRDGKAR